MIDKIRQGSTAIAIAVICLATMGCTASKQREAFRVERLLAASGFKMQFASTPELVAHLATVKPQRQLAPAPVGDKMMYFYADAQFCQCMYAGDTDAYGRFQKLAVQREISENLRTAAQANEAASMNVWGPWGPWGVW